MKVSQEKDHHSDGLFDYLYLSGVNTGTSWIRFDTSVIDTDSILYAVSESFLSSAGATPVADDKLIIAGITERTARRRERTYPKNMVGCVKVYYLFLSDMRRLMLNVNKSCPPTGAPVAWSLMVTGASPQSFTQRRFSSS